MRITATVSVPLKMCIRDRAETVSYQVEYTTDDTMYEGESRVIQEGANGEIVTTWSIEYENGREVSRSAKSVETNIEPVNEIIAQGTMERPYYMSYGSYIWPTDGVITSYYGYRDVTVGTSYHEGLDIAGQYRSYVVAADGGKVIYAQYNSALGNLVKIQHDNGDVTWYGHNDELCEMCIRDRCAPGVSSVLKSYGLPSGKYNLQCEY